MGHLGTRPSGWSEQAFRMSDPAGGDLIFISNNVGQQSVDGRARLTAWQAVFPVSRLFDKNQAAAPRPAAE
jgi:hypothetical protein